MNRLEINRVKIIGHDLPETVKFAFFSDLHNAPFKDALDAVKDVDAILMSGDILDRHRSGTEHAMQFLKEAPHTAPVFFSIGNHESRSREWKEFRIQMENSCVTLLDDRFISFKGLTLGGLSSRERDSHQLPVSGFEAMRSFVDLMAEQKGYTILLCHHPEYYPHVIAGHGIDLTLSGHAHGGQVRLFGQGVYAPGQGLFPKYTSGFYDNGHLLVSRGMTNSAKLPRFGNPCEILILDIHNGHT